MYVPNRNEAYAPARDQAYAFDEIEEYVSNAAYYSRNRALPTLRGATHFPQLTPVTSKVVREISARAVGEGAHDSGCAASIRHQHHNRRTARQGF